MEENIVIQKASVIPYYTTGILWVIYASFFPLYQLMHFVLLAILSIGLFLVLKKTIPPQTITITRPITSGDVQLDTLMREGTEFLHQLRNHREHIDNPVIQGHIRRMETATTKIFQHIQTHPAKQSAIRRFMNYYLPTITKLLASYDLLEDQQLSAQSITEAMKGIESVMDQAALAFDHQLEMLFSAQTMDIAAEIKVLEHMIKKEGLFPSEFQEQVNNQERNSL